MNDDNKGLKNIRGRLLEDQEVNLGGIKETIIGKMALIFGSQSDDWQPPPSRLLCIFRNDILYHSNCDNFVLLGCSLIFDLNKMNSFEQY